MKKTDNFQTSTGEMVTISRAEYEELQAQRKKISELESRVEVLMEALRLARHKQFGASSEKSEDTLTGQLSFLFNEPRFSLRRRRQKLKMSLQLRPTSGTRSTNILWIPFPMALKRSRWSTVWRARIWCAHNAEIP